MMDNVQKVQKTEPIQSLIMLGADVTPTLHYVIWQVDVSISEQHAASTFRVEVTSNLNVEKEGSSKTLETYYGT